MSADQLERLRAAQLQQVQEHAAAAAQQRAVEVAHEQAQAELAHKLRTELLTVRHRGPRSLTPSAS